MSSNREFLKNKLQNFKLFCANTFPNNETMKKQLENFNTMPIESFIVYIKEFVYPHKNDMESFFIRLSNDYNIKMDTVKEEDKDKFKRYFKLFVDFIDEINITN